MRNGGVGVLYQASPPQKKIWGYPTLSVQSKFSQPRQASKENSMEEEMLDPNIAMQGWTSEEVDAYFDDCLARHIEGWG